MKEAKAIDQENGNYLWEEAVFMEMTNNPVPFEHYEGNNSDLVEYEEITGPFIFDVKQSDNFRRKASFVTDGHLVDTPETLTYSTVVSRESVRILLLADDLNDLKTMVSDMQNYFLSSENIEKHWIRAGPKFGSEQGKVFIVI